ncbi:MAG: hypothetical protein K9N06_12675 [Candidatus Cloacimonetes bacterium]|nr:hypothetical protein [Candidatus Cloacimonadota bacterium]
MKHLGMIIFMGILGLIVGYLVFGNLNGKVLPISTIFGSNDTVVERTLDTISGVDDIREKITYSGIGGAIAGLLISIVRKRNRD